MYDQNQIINLKCFNIYVSHRPVNSDQLSVKYILYLKTDCEVQYRSYLFEQELI